MHEIYLSPCSVVCIFLSIANRSDGYRSVCVTVQSFVWQLRGLHGTYYGSWTHTSASVVSASATFVERERSRPKSCPDGIEADSTAKHRQRPSSSNSCVTTSCCATCKSCVRPKSCGATSVDEASTSHPATEFRCAIDQYGSHVDDATPSSEATESVASSGSVGKFIWRRWDSGLRSRIYIETIGGVDNGCTEMWRTFDRGFDNSRFSTSWCTFSSFGGSVHVSELLKITFTLRVSVHTNVRCCSVMWIAHSLVKCGEITYLICVFADSSCLFGICLWMFIISIQIGK